MPKPQRFCIFCGDAGLSREHIWADWIKAYVPKDIPKHAAAKATTHKGHTEKTVKVKSGDPRSQRRKIVCRNCNHGWMRILQDQAKPFLIPLMLAKPVSLDRTAQNVISRWAMMSVICGEFLAGTDNIAISSSDREHLFNKKEPPANWNIWIANYRRDDWRGYWIHDTISITEKDISQFRDSSLPIPDTQTTTFVTGQLYTLAFSCPFADITRDIGFGITARSGLSRIWPFESDILWPTKAISDRDADNYAGAILDTLEELDREARG